MNDIIKRARELVAAFDADPTDDADTISLLVENLTALCNLAEQMRKERDVLRECWEDAHRVGNQRLAELNAVRAHADGVWFWQGCGDHPESLSCPVVMTADTVRDWLSERDSLRAQLAAVEKERDEAVRLAQEQTRRLCNLLARIHRDGGHYTTAHGMAKSLEDADLIVATLLLARNDFEQDTAEQIELRRLRALLATPMPADRQVEHLAVTTDPDGWVNIPGCGCWRPHVAIALGAALIRAGLEAKERTDAE